METNRVYFSISQLKIMTAKHVLAEAGIPSISLDKMDSAHALPFGGSIELYVDASHAGRAKEILQREEILD